MRPTREQRAPRGHRRCGNGVTRAAVTDAEPVEDDEDDRSGSGSGSGWSGSAPGRAGRVRHLPAQPARPRARAVMPARATIPAISSGLSEAPPTSAPSMDGSAKKVSMFVDVTLPPYRTGISEAPSPQPSAPMLVRIASAIAAASAPVALR